MSKTAITLSAIFALCLDSFLVRKVLVIAPLRVARDTWPAEIHKWDHLHGLTYSVAVGTETERKAALRQRVSVYIINRENVQWLVEESGLPFDYDMVVIDELSSFKSYQAKRFRSLLKVRPGIKRIVGLTGTPSSNGLMDLWAEFRILDMGKRLGRFITHYRNTFFRPDKRNGQVVFSYKPLPGAEEQIYDAISDITISMKAVDHLDMPECVHNDAIVTLSETERKAYDAMKQDLVISLKGEEIDAGNAAALANKLSQMANGAVYGEDKRVFQIHDRKLDMLEDLIEAANGKPVLVAYWFKHDLQRIQERFHVREIRTSRDIADYYVALAAKVSDRKMAANWVMGELSAAVNGVEGMTFGKAPVTPEILAAILGRILDNTVNQKGAKQIFAAVWEGEGTDVDALIESKGLKQISDTGALEGIIDEVLAANQKSVDEFRAGKQKAFNALVGQCMKATRGKANPAQVNELLRKKLGA